MPLRVVELIKQARCNAIVIKRLPDVLNTFSGLYLNFSVLVKSMSSCQKI